MGSSGFGLAWIYMGYSIGCGRWYVSTTESFSPSRAGGGSIAGILGRW